MSLFKIVVGVAVAVAGVAIVNHVCSEKKQTEDTAKNMSDDLRRFRQANDDMQNASENLNRTMRESEIHSQNMMASHTANMEHLRNHFNHG